MKNNTNLKLGQISYNVEKILKEVSTDEQLANLTYGKGKEIVYAGFQCRGQLCNYKGYENFFERLWVWSTVNEKGEVNIIATADRGNCYCYVAYYDLYIEEIIEMEELLMKKNMRNVEVMIKNYTSKEDYAKDVKELVHSGKYIIENEIGFNTIEHGQENQVEYRATSLIKMYLSKEDYDNDVKRLVQGKGYTIENEIGFNGDNGQEIQVEYKLACAS